MRGDKGQLSKYSRESLSASAFMMTVIFLKRTGISKLVKIIITHKFSKRKIIFNVCNTYVLPHVWDVIT